MTRAAALVIVACIATAACSAFPRPGDPHRLVGDDPRVVECGIPIGEMWMAFPMAHAREFSQHFPGWSQGAPELEVDDPALVIIGPPHGGGIDGTYVDMCIAVGPPNDAILHRYPGVSFDGIRPDLGGPAYPLPTSAS